MTASRVELPGGDAGHAERVQARGFALGTSVEVGGCDSTV
jgi:hypothetical protein